MKEGLVFKMGDPKTTNSPVAKLMDNITDYVRNILAEDLSKEDSASKSMHPSVLITLVATNIVLNLCQGAIVANSCEQRKRMVRDLSLGIAEMVQAGWEVVEQDSPEREEVH